VTEAMEVAETETETFGANAKRNPPAALLALEPKPPACPLLPAFSSIDLVDCQWANSRPELQVAFEREVVFLSDF
jgi:hypothetical protein